MSGHLSEFRAWLSAGPKAGRRRLMVAVPALALAYFLLGGRQGLVALVMSQREKAKLREEIVQLRSDNERLRAEADATARNPYSCEKTARENLQLMRPGEIIYRFQ